MKDRLGQSISVGAKVKVIALPAGLAEELPPDEFERVRSMLNDTLEVYEIDEYERAWVEKWWEHDEANFDSHSLGLSAEEIELVADVS